MANRELNYYHLFVILVLLVTVKLAAAEESRCIEYRGPCGPAGQCERNCKADHSDGVASCSFQSLCVCTYVKGCKPHHVKNAAVKFMAIPKQK
ncbi:hypothetical protein Lalb_Chr11g0074891 [Lupinus albus]|uniref:Defensin-like protein n=1 Tax=Lupinus albus TaxID=3870 RepID=A0A6A4PTB7_LUPAL|nr:hypothetical protein Lalb_Chr11g0074891 [Lupinus albus]